MLNADQVNIILDSLIDTFEQNVPTLSGMSVGAPEGVSLRSSYGSVILGALVTGPLEGKVTLIFDWDLAAQVVEGLTHIKQVSFDETAKRAIEGLFQQSLTAMTDELRAQGLDLEASLLPTLTDSSVLFGEEGECGAVRLPLHVPTGGFDLYLSFR